MTDLSNRLYGGDTVTSGPRERNSDGTLNLTRTIWPPEQTWIRCIFVEFFSTAMFSTIFLLGIETMTAPVEHAFARGFAMFVVLLLFGYFNIKNWAYEDVVHINPFVTMGFWMTGRTSLIMGLVYIFLCQPGGVAIGTLLTYAITYNLPGTQYGTPSLGAGFTVNEAFGYEIWGTFTYVFAHIWLFNQVRLSDELKANNAGCYDQRCCWLLETPYGILAAIAGLTLVGYNISNAIFNPWLYLWPSVYAGITSNDGCFIWMLGPVIGGVIAVLFVYFYDFLVRRDYDIMCNPVCQTTKPVSMNPLANR